MLTFHLRKKRRILPTDILCILVSYRIIFHNFSLRQIDTAERKTQHFNLQAKQFLRFLLKSIFNVFVIAAIILFLCIFYPYFSFFVQRIKEIIIRTI